MTDGTHPVRDPSPAGEPSPATLLKSSGPLGFLVCVGGGPESRQTLTFAVRVVKALGGEVTVLYVAPPLPHSIREEVLLSQQKLAEWEMELPGMDVLRYARELLREAGVLRLEPTGVPSVQRPLAHDADGAYEAHLRGSYGETVRFRIRGGDIAEEIRSEVRAGGYDLLIIGAGTNRRLQHKLAQFAETSILFVKTSAERYRLLGAPA